jgi:hypothetical protein
MLKYTSGEFTMILSLPEIFILDLCLVLQVIAYLQFHNSPRRKCWRPSLVLDQSNSERKFGSRSALFNFICIYLDYGN